MVGGAGCRWGGLIIVWGQVGHKGGVGHSRSQPSLHLNGAHALSRSDVTFEVDFASDLDGHFG